jgi:RNA polymerase sigma-70 factor (ECF subfamily)
MSLEELISACAESGDAAAWEEFVRRFHALIAGVVVRTARRWGRESPSLVDDLVQDTYLKICSDRKRMLREFSPFHPEAFYGYLKVVTANVVHDHFRLLQTQKRGRGQQEVQPDEIEHVQTSAVTTIVEGIHRDIFLKEINEALCSTSTEDDLKRDRAIFWLYYRYGLTATAIARLPSIDLTVKGVESVIHRLTKLVRERLTERDGALS